MTPELAQKVLRGGSEAIAVVRGIYQTHVEKLDALESDAQKILDAAAMLPLVWIPVSERLPPAPESEWEDSVAVLAWSKSHGIDTACFIRDKDYGDRWGWECVGDPTHWMPLPEPPEVQ